MTDLEKHRAYYAKNARNYDATWAFCKQDEHYTAVAMLSGLIDLHEIKSVLDVGCGTGRGLSYLRDHHSPSLELEGLEPVEELRQECLAKGFAGDRIRSGDARELPYEDASFDCVAMFGILHHIDVPERAIEEAFRVARKMVFLSDHNVYGMGTTATRAFKRTMRRMGMRSLLFRILTRGKGYHDTSWDGLFYPFSLIDHFDAIQKRSTHLYSMSTKTPAIDLLKDASHLAISAIK